MEVRRSVIVVRGAALTVSGVEASPVRAYASARTCLAAQPDSVHSRRAVDARAPFVCVTRGTHLIVRALRRGCSGMRARAALCEKARPNRERSAPIREVCPWSTVKFASMATCVIAIELRFLPASQEARPSSRSTLSNSQAASLGVCRTQIASAGCAVPQEPGQAWRRAACAHVDMLWPLLNRKRRAMASCCDTVGYASMHCRWCAIRVARDACLCGCKKYHSLAISLLASATPPAEAYMQHR